MGSKVLRDFHVLVGPKVTTLIEYVLDKYHVLDTETQTIPTLESIMQDEELQRIIINMGQQSDEPKKEKKIIKKKKPEESKAEEPKAEEPNAEEPNTEQAAGEEKVEEHKVEGLISEEPYGLAPPPHPNSVAAKKAAATMEEDEADEEKTEPLSSDDENYEAEIYVYEGVEYVKQWDEDEKKYIITDADDGTELGLPDDDGTIIWYDDDAEKQHKKRVGIEGQSSDDEQ